MAEITVATPPTTVAVPFYGDTLFAREENGEVWVLLRHCCDCLGVDYSAQLQKLRERSWATVGQSPMVASDGKVRDCVFITLDTLAGWLMSINEDKVAPEARTKLVQYQKEAVRVLRQHFLGGGDRILGMLDAMRELRLRELSLEQQVGVVAQAVDEVKAEIEETKETVSKVVEMAEDLKEVVGIHGGYSLIVGFLRRLGKKVRNPAVVAKKVVQYCAGQPDAIKKVKYKYGWLNTYRDDVLEQFFQNNQQYFLN